jgi:hypothetical protein
MVVDMTGFNSKRDAAADKLQDSKCKCVCHDGCAACDARAQPAQEPMATVTATVTSESGNQDVTMSWWHEPALPVGTKLYTAPPQRPWVGLMDEELADYLGDEYHNMTTSELRFFRLGEAAAKEKNV